MKIIFNNLTCVNYFTMMNITLEIKKMCRMAVLIQC